MKPKPRRLKIARLDEISLVDRGANPLARVLVWKRDNTEKPVADEKTLTMLQKIARALGLGSDGEPVEKRVKEMPNGKWMAMGDDGKEMGEFDTEAEARRAAYGEKKQEKREMSEQEKPETVTKAEMVELQKKLDDLTKRAEMAEADAKANAEKVEKMAEAERVAGFVKKADALKSLPLKAAEFGPIMAKIAKALEPTEFAEIERVLGAANEVARTGRLFEEIGSGAAEGSAEAKVQAEVEKIRKADPKLTEQAARGQVFKANPQLRREVEAETAGRAR